MIRGYHLNEMNERSLAQMYIPLVLAMARKYSTSLVSTDDLVQEGFLGLVEAERLFDPSKGVDFSTYAAYWVRKKMLALVDRERRHALETVRLDEELLPAAPPPGDEQGEKPGSCAAIYENLPVLERQVVNLIFWERKSTPEAARILGISKERVRQLRERALRRFRANKALTDHLDLFNDCRVRTGEGGKAWKTRSKP